MIQDDTRTHRVIADEWKRRLDKSDEPGGADGLTTLDGQWRRVHPSRTSRMRRIRTGDTGGLYTAVGNGGLKGAGPGRSTEGGGCFLCGGPHLKKGKTYIHRACSFTQGLS